MDRYNFLWGLWKKKKNNNSVLYKFLLENSSISRALFSLNSINNLILLRCIYWKFHNDTPWSHAEQVQSFLISSWFAFHEDQRWLRAYIIYLSVAMAICVKTKALFLYCSWESFFPFPISALPLTSQARGKEWGEGEGLEAAPWARLQGWTHFFRLSQEWLPPPSSQLVM